MSRHTALMARLDETLRSLVGPRNFSVRDAHLPLLSVTPENEEQVQKLVLLCAEENLKIYTSSITGVTRGGVKLNLGALSRISGVDAKNLFATIGPGVTFDQLGGELRKSQEKMKLAFPVAASSPSVLRCYVDRAVTPLDVSLLGRTLHISNLHILLPSGEIYKTGSHIISEEDNWREEDYGPGISYLFFGAQDTLGICLRAVISLYPVQEVRRVKAWSLPGKGEAVAFLAAGARRRLWVEAFAANRGFLTMLLRCSPPGDRPWLVVGSIEGSEKLVCALEEQALRLAREADGYPVDAEPLTSLCHRPWPLKERRRPCGDFTDLPFFTLPSKLFMLDEIVRTQVEPSAELLVPLKGGRSFYCEYDLFHPADRATAMRRQCRQLLADSGDGIVPGRPSWQSGFDTLTLPQSLRRIMLEIKKRIDPLSLFNPHLWAAEEEVV